MAIEVADYSAANFNRLLDYGDVLPKFDSLGGNDLAYGVMKDLFRRHKVEGVIGLALLHKHLILEDGERLTDVRGTSNPLTFELGRQSVWKVGSDGRKLVPLEFSIAQRDIDWQMPSMQEFLTEFSELLGTHNAENILGLCSYPGDGYPGRVEFTVGRSNINLTPDEVRLPSSSDITELMMLTMFTRQNISPRLARVRRRGFIRMTSLGGVASATASKRRTMTTPTGILFRPKSQIGVRVTKEGDLTD